jgi:hypothetical protein
MKRQIKVLVHTEASRKHVAEVALRFKITCVGFFFKNVRNILKFPYFFSDWWTLKYTEKFNVFV